MSGADPRERRFIVEVWSCVLIALMALLAAGGLMYWHLRTWRTVQQRATELGPKELDYRRRQFRRRMQTSAMLALVGVGILVGWLLLVFRAPPLLTVIFWSGVMLLVVWLALLAMADVLSTRYYFSRLKQDYLVEKARLQAELRRMERGRADGQADACRGKQQKAIEKQEPSSEDEGAREQP